MFGAIVGGVVVCDIENGIGIILAVLNVAMWLMLLCMGIAWEDGTIIGAAGICAVGVVAMGYVGGHSAGWCTLRGGAEVRCTVGNGDPVDIFVRAKHILLNLVMV